MEYWLNQFHVFLLILLRVSALLVVTPLFGHRNYLARAKIGLGFVISVVVFPLVDADTLQIPDGFFPYAIMIVREILMGLVLGFSVLLFFIAVQFAGQLIGFQMGFGIVSVVDPQSSEQVSIIGQFMSILAILIVLTVDGHLLILRGLIASFEVVPLGGVQFPEVIITKLIDLSSDIFVIAVKMSAPVMISLLMISVAMGVLARTVPQMNVFLVGFPVQITVGMLVLVSSLPLFLIVMNKSLDNLERNLFALIGFF